MHESPKLATRDLAPLILGRLNGESDDVMAEYAEDVKRLAELRLSLTTLVYQQREAARDLEETRTKVEVQTAEAYGGDKAKWGNEQARKATLAQAFQQCAAYQDLVSGIEALSRDIDDTRSEISYYEESQAARRWWARFHVAQSLQQVGLVGEALGLD